MRKNISPETKAAVLADIAAGMKTKDVAEKHGVGTSSIAKWRSGNKNPGADAPRKEQPAAAADLDRLLIRFAEKMLDLSDRRTAKAPKIASASTPATAPTPAAATAPAQTSAEEAPKA